MSIEKNPHPEESSNEPISEAEQKRRVNKIKAKLDAVVPARLRIQPAEAVAREHLAILETQLTQARAEIATLTARLAALEGAQGEPFGWVYRWKKTEPWQFTDNFPPSRNAEVVGLYAHPPAAAEPEQRWTLKRDDHGWMILLMGDAAGYACAPVYPTHAILAALLGDASERTLIVRPEG